MYKSKKPQISLKSSNTRASNEDKINNNNSVEMNNDGEKKYGKCKTCNGCNTSERWCQLCDPQSLIQGWTSGNETIDELIKRTQLESKYYDNSCYLQWIPYDDLKDIEKIGEGGFAIIYKAIWLKGNKYIDVDYSGNNKKCIENRV